MRTFKQHVESVKPKTTSHVTLIHCLAIITWGAITKTMHTSTHALVFSAVEYGAPVWSHSHHAKKVDVNLNIALRIISGTLPTTPVNQLPILAGIIPASIRREAAMLVCSRKAQKSESHLFYREVTERPQCAGVKSRCPFATHAHKLLAISANVSKAK